MVIISAVDIKQGRSAAILEDRNKIQDDLGRLEG